MHRSILAAVLAALMASPVSAQVPAPSFQSGDTASAPRRSPKATTKAKQKKSSSTAQASSRPIRAASATSGGGFFSSFWDSDDDDEDRPAKPLKPTEPIVVSGGPRPDIEPQSPSQASFSSGQPAGTIVIDSAARRLYLIQGPSSALSYPVSVGREGFRWAGTERISRIADWPDWHPPAEMRERDPKLPTKMTGGVRNPLGAKALYLGNSLYRIHGTSDARSVGRAASSGCFRMHNAHVVDLARRVGVGTKVVVINAGTRTASER